jgi:hypothetical protein
MRAVDAFNTKFGRAKVSFGTTAPPSVWHLRSELLSARYTTEWEELLRVRNRCTDREGLNASRDEPSRAGYPRN